MNWTLYPVLETLPPIVRVKSRWSEDLHDKLEELEREFTDLSIEVNWPDEELTAEQEEDLRDRMRVIRREIEEIEEELGL